MGPDKSEENGCKIDFFGFCTTGYLENLLNVLSKCIIYKQNCYLQIIHTWREFFLKILKRPLYNLKTLDIGFIFFLLIFFGITIFAVFNKQQLTMLGEAVTFLFSFEFYKVVPIESGQSFTPKLFEISNQLAPYLNGAKILWWIFLLVLTLRFLFKKPINLKK